MTKLFSANSNIQTMIFCSVEDQVHMHEGNLLEEYILNETGKIYVGSTKRISSRPWAFGQVIHFIYLFVFLIYFTALDGGLPRGNDCIDQKKKNINRNKTNVTM